MKDIIVTGRPGTGKTYLINKLKEQSADFKYSAATWVAAQLTNSETYYRVLKIKPNFEKETKIKIHPNTYGTLLIDEASMLSLNQYLILKKMYPHLRFILVGDWDQLLPVNGEPINGDFNVYELKTNYRSKDPDLLNLLEAIVNNNNQYVKDVIKTRTIEEHKIPEGAIHIYWHNRSSDYIKETGRIENGSRNLNFFKTGSKLIAAKVIFVDIENDRSEIELENTAPVYAPNGSWWMNNEIVEIIGSKGGDIYVKRPNVNDGKDKRTISLEDRKFFFNGEYLTAHKVQGQTIRGNIVIHLESFNKNKDLNETSRLLYVAISRATSLNSVYFVGRLSKVVNFYYSKLSLFNDAVSINQEDLLNTLSYEFLQSYIYNIYGNVCKNSEFKFNRQLRIPKKWLVILGDQTLRRQEKCAILKISRPTLSKINKRLPEIIAYFNDDEKTDEQIKPASGRLYFKNKFSVALAKEIFNKPSKETQFETLNPVCLNITDGHKTPRSSDNVSSMRSFIFECDDTSKEDQLKLLERNRDIINRAVDSGNKSIHMKITIDKEPEDIIEYKKIWKYINEKYFDSKADSACSDPARLTRCPNAVRDNGNIQTLIYESDVIMNKPVIEKTFQELYPENYRISNVVSNDKPWIQKLQAAKTERAELVRKFPTMPDGTRHENVWKVIGWLKWAGAAKAEAADYIKSSGIKDWKTIAEKVYSNSK